MSLESTELITKASNAVLASPLANGPYNPVMEWNFIEELKQFYRQRSRILSLFRTSKAGATDASWVADVQMLGDPMPGSSLADKFMYVNFTFFLSKDTF